MWTDQNGNVYVNGVCYGSGPDAFERAREAVEAND